MTHLSKRSMPSVTTLIGAAFVFFFFFPSSAIFLSLLSCSFLYNLLALELSLLEIEVLLSLFIICLPVSELTLRLLCFFSFFFGAGGGRTKPVEPFKSPSLCDLLLLFGMIDVFEGLFFMWEAFCHDLLLLIVDGLLLFLSWLLSPPCAGDSEPLVGVLGVSSEYMCELVLCKLSSIGTTCHQIFEKMKLSRLGWCNGYLYAALDFINIIFEWGVIIIINIIISICSRGKKST